MLQKHEVLTTTEAMDFLRCTRPTILKLIREGKLKAFRVGQNYRILREDLNKFIRGETKEVKAVANCN